MDGQYGFELGLGRVETRGKSGCHCGIDVDGFSEGNDTRGRVFGSGVRVVGTAKSVREHATVEI